MSSRDKGDGGKLVQKERARIILSSFCVICVYRMFFFSFRIGLGVAYFEWKRVANRTLDKYISMHLKSKSLIKERIKMERMKSQNL